MSASPPPEDAAHVAGAGSLRTVALFEAAKGALALAAGLGLLSLLHRDVAQLAHALVHHLHLNPDWRLIQDFLRQSDELSRSRELMLAAGAALYASVRFVEAWGLWFQRRWAEWFAAVSGAVYVPFELRELLVRPGWLSVLLLLANLAVVGVMVRALWLRRRTAARIT